MKTRPDISRQSRWLLIISGIFSLSVGLSNTFVNIYLWKVDKSYGAIGYYNLALYVLVPVMFVIAGRIAKRLNTIWTMRMGIVLHCVFYAVALFGGAAVARMPLVLGSVMGAAAGFYWLSFNMLSIQVTAAGKRDKFFGWNGVMGAISGIIAPPVAGYLITKEDTLGGLSGYHVIFAISLALFAFAAFLSTRLKEGHDDEVLQLGRAWRTLRHRPWRLTLAGCAIYGMREGVFLFLIGLLVYISTKSEFGLGKFLLLQSALSSISFYLAGRIIRPTNRVWVLGVGSVLMAFTALILLIPVTVRSIVWYGSIIAIVLPLFLVPLQGLVFDGIGAVDEEEKQHMELVIVREIFQNAGRVAGIVLFMLLTSGADNPRKVALFAVGLGFVQLGTFGFIAFGRIQSFISARLQARDKHEGHALSATDKIKSIRHRPGRV